MFLPGLLQAWCIVRLLRKFGRSFRTCFLRVMDLQIIQLQKDLASFSQGERSVTKYFTNLSILWDEI